MLVLVIGGSGYLGTTIVRAFRRDGAAVAVALSRSGSEGITGDVRQPGLEIQSDPSALRAAVTHIVSCFGSVDWSLSPADALAVHDRGMENVLAFAEACPGLERLIHVSSLLVHGRARRQPDNRSLYEGQTFRNWYEYGKYVAEQRVRDSRVPWRTIRFGPLLGPIAGHGSSMSTGLLAALPLLLAGYPVHLTSRGEFPCYVGDVAVAAEVVAQAAQFPGEGDTWTWYDASLPSLRETLVRLCKPWKVMPKIVDIPMLGWAQRRLSRRIGVEVALIEYTEGPWFQLDPQVLESLPFAPPPCRAEYVEATGEALLRSGLIDLTAV